MMSTALWLSLWLWTRCRKWMFRCRNWRSSRLRPTKWIGSLASSNLDVIYTTLASCWSRDGLRLAWSSHSEYLSRTRRGGDSHQVCRLCSRYSTMQQLYPYANSQSPVSSSTRYRTTPANFCAHSATRDSSWLRPRSWTLNLTRHLRYRRSNEFSQLN